MLRHCKNVKVSVTSCFRLRKTTIDVGKGTGKPRLDPARCPAHAQNRATNASRPAQRAICDVSWAGLGNFRSCPLRHNSTHCLFVLPMLISAGLKTLPRGSLLATIADMP